MINYSETAVGSPCYVKINFLQWKPEIYKTIIEELTLKCEDLFLSLSLSLSLSKSGHHRLNVHEFEQTPGDGEG